MSLDNCDDLSVVTADLTTVDDCPVLRRMRCFLVEQGTCRTLEWGMRSRSGAPVSLRGCLTLSVSESESGDENNSAVLLRVQEISGKNINSLGTLLYEVTGTVVDQDTGIVRASIPNAVANTPGIYLLNWGVKNDDGDLVFTNEAYLSVERGLFGTPASSGDVGPPTINEIRLSLMDSDPSGNLLLDDIEFDAAQVAQAVIRPISYFNEALPPLPRLYTTKNFPFREHWMSAIHGYLFMAAAHNYRRNNLPYSAGGVSIDDKGKEKEYMSTALLLLDEWKSFVRNTKISMNAQLAFGSLDSQYLDGQ